MRMRYLTIQSLERSKNLGAKGTWNSIRSSEKIGRGSTGMKAIRRRSPVIMRAMNLPKMMTKTSHHTGK